MQHHSEEYGHLIALSLADLSVWCYGCDSYISNSVSKLQSSIGYVNFPINRNAELDTLVRRGCAPQKAAHFRRTFFVGIRPGAVRLRGFCDVAANVIDHRLPHGSTESQRDAVARWRGSNLLGVLVPWSTLDFRVARTTSLGIRFLRTSMRSCKDDAPSFRKVSRELHVETFWLKFYVFHTFVVRLFWDIFSHL